MKRSCTSQLVLTCVRTLTSNWQRRICFWSHPLAHHGSWAARCDTNAHVQRSTWASHLQVWLIVWPAWLADVCLKAVKLMHGPAVCRFGIHAWESVINICGWAWAWQLFAGFYSTELRGSVIDGLFNLWGSAWIDSLVLLIVQGFTPQSQFTLCPQRWPLFPVFFFFSFLSNIEGYPGSIWSPPQSPSASVLPQ